MSKGRPLSEELKMSGFSSPAQKVLLNLMFTSAWWETKVHELLKEHGLSEQQYNVLRIIKGQKGTPMNVYMIQERMIHRTSNVTRVVEKLRQKGLLERVVSEADRRQVEVTITEEGRRVLERVTPEMEVLMGEMSENLSEEETERLFELLEKVRGG